ncbi:MAG TPA: DUF2341 domain-containing protein, partial [Candidatus Nanoarchaeia archaeon]|nr:DUF2341 domain-containing protein [Candidatus Nanoarchaeia archaeon]
ASVASDWDPYDSSVSNGAFSANGICIGATADTTAEACYDGANYQSSCASCGQTTSNNDACDSSITDGSYASNGMCVSGNTCDTNEVCDNEGTILSDCSSCSSANTDVDKCDSNGGTSFGGDGYCTTGGTCSTGVVYNNSGTLTNSCTNGGGQQCDSDAGGTEDGVWSSYADGVCVSGTTCGTSSVCLNTGVYYGAMGSCSDDNSCDSDVDSSGYVSDGLVCNSQSLGCVVNATRTVGQSCCSAANCDGGLACTGNLCASADPVPQWSLNSSNSTDAGAQILHSVYWTDNTALAGYIFSFDNGTGTFVNDSFVDMIGASNWSNVTKGVNTTGGVTIQWKIYANDSSSGWNVTSTFSYVTIDVTKPQWSLNSTNSTVKNSSINHSVYWTDNTALAGYIFSFDNGTGTFVNDSFVSMIGTTNWSNVIKIVNSTYNVTIRWIVYANDSSNNWNITSVFSYLTTNTPPQWSLNSSNSTVKNSSINHSVYWTEETALSGYIFSFDNGTGTFVNDSFVSMIGTTNWSNVIKIVNSTYNVTIRWIVYANDSDNGWNSTSTLTYLTTNIVPTTPTPDLLSVDGTNSTNSNLNCSDTISDSNGDPLNVSVRWYKNAALNLSVDYNNSYSNNVLFNASLASGNLTSGDIWMCSLRLYDGIDYSSWGNSSNLTIVYPKINLNVLYPTGNINVSRNQFFNVTLNVTCSPTGGNCGTVNVSLDPDNWANASCNNRRQLTFSKPYGTQNLTNFPILVVLNSSRIDYSKTGATDIRFYDADNTTLLNKETELWNSSGNSYIWVKTPQLNNDTSDYIWAYYNCSTTNADNKVGVWDSSYTAVYHSNSPTAGVLNDSTSQHNGTQANSPTAATGKIDGAMQYAVASQQYYSTDITSGDTFTWEVWANVTSYTTYHSMVAIATSYMLFDQLSGALSMWSTDGMGGSDGGISGLSTNTLYHLVFVREGDSITGGYKFYKNGISSGTTYNTGAWAASTAIYIADRSDTLSQAFNGVLDEVRISSTNRSVSWINASYLTEIDNFLTYGSEENETSTKSGLISTVAGTTPFYTNASTNPFTTASLNAGQSETVIFWVNATGDLNTTHTFFAYANTTANTSISNITANWNVTIAEIFSVAIDLSSSLGQQINWTLASLPAVNQSAQGNNGTNPNITSFWVDVSVSYGTADLYMRANDNLSTLGGSILLLGNETYSYNYTNASVSEENKTPMTTNYSNHKIGSALASGNTVVYLRFFLNAPLGQTAGTYNNTLSFTAVQTGQSPG